MYGAIKYKYATDAEGNIFDIEQLTEKDRKDYECIGCGNILRPVLGQKKQKHFRHKSSVSCSEETYLHRIGKLLFFNHYKKCLSTGTPFYIKYLTRKRCIYCEYGPCTILGIPEQYDLTKHFKEIKLETKDGDFIPDLLLTTLSNQTLYIEIAVTHSSSEEKIDSKNKIIELNIETEEDLKIITSSNISELNEKVDFFNFEFKIKEGNFQNLCLKYIDCFVVYPSGKSGIFSKKAIEISKLKNFNQYYIKTIDFPCGETYIEEVERAFSVGIKIKDCFLCRYHGEADVLERAYREDNPIFCKFLKKAFGSNQAAKCKYFRADKKVFKFFTSEK